MKKQLYTWLFFIAFFFCNHLHAQVDVIPIGTSPNAFVSAFGAKTQLWADPALNAISLIHRGSLDSLLYDYSKNGGITWSINNGRVFGSSTQRPRYPQAVIYNPAGNTNPDSAYISFMAAITDGVNWTNIVQGSKKLNPASLSSWTLTPNATTGHLIPEDLIITPQGTLWNIDPYYLSQSQYADSLIITKGTWNSSTRNFDLTSNALYAPASGNAPVSCRIAFAPNGQIGYVVVDGHQSFSVQPDSVLYPTVYITKDGGNTWGPPVSINLGNVDVIFQKGTQSYSLGFEIDAAVDAAGNLHIVSNIMLSAGQFSVSTANRDFGIFDIYTTDQGKTWYSQFLAFPETFRATFGDGSTANPTIAEDNRPQVSIDSSGTKVFFSWFDTDTLAYGTNENMIPDLYVRGYDIISKKLTPVINFTKGTNADGFCTFGTASYYTLSSSGSYTIPVVINMLAGPFLTGSPVAHGYITGVTITDSQFNVNSSPVVLFAASKYYKSGLVYYDLNSNGKQDTGDYALLGQKISVQPLGATVFTNGIGRYNYHYLQAVFGSQTMSLNVPPKWVLTSDSASFFVADDTLNETGFDFGIYPTQVFNDMEVYVAGGIPRCSRDVTYTVTYVNKGTTNIDGRIFFIKDPKTTFVQSTPPPNAFTGDTLTYQFTSLQPYTQRQITITLHLPNSPSDTIRFEAVAQIDSSGTFFGLDEDGLRQTIVCSYDPNDKSVSPEGVSASNYTLYSDLLKYTVRFQNTGNDTAFTVIVRDTISNSLDINTLQVVASSHPVETSIYPSAIVEFRFTDILLPDSIVNYIGSNGFIQYTIKAKAGLALPTVISNTAYIYFDYNAAVKTNQTKNTLVLVIPTNIVSTSMDDGVVKIVPNPFHNEASIVINDELFKPASVKVINSLGELVFEQSLILGNNRLARGNLSSGVYFYELRGKEGRAYYGKFIIE